MLQKGTVLHSMYRGALVFVSFGIVTLMMGHTEWGTITLGSIATALVHFIASQLEK